MAGASTIRSPVREPLAVVGVLLIIILGKSVAAFAVVLLLGYPAATGGGGGGRILGLLPPAGRDLILAGALLSITLNPLAFAVAERLAAAGRATPHTAWWFTTYGKGKLASLQGALANLRKRTEVRAAERGLQIRQLVDRFPVFADLDCWCWNSATSKHS